MRLSIIGSPESSLVISTGRPKSIINKRITSGSPRTCACATGACSSIANARETKVRILFSVTGTADCLTVCASGYQCFGTLQVHADQLADALFHHGHTKQPVHARHGYGMVRD